MTVLVVAVAAVLLGSWVYCVLTIVAVKRHFGWRTLQRAALNFSSPMRDSQKLPAEDRQPHDKSCATAYTVYPFFNERFSPRQRRRRLRNER